VTSFDRAELIAFLRAVDRSLTQKVELVVVGGAAAAVGYGASIRTSDVDVLRVVAGSLAALGAAVDRARAETGLRVSVGAAPVADLPYDYEARLKPVRGLALKRLAIRIPDKYDLALSKTMRGYPHDIDAIESMHRRHRLASATLVRRFETELMKVAVADPRRIALNVAAVVARLYGFAEGRKLAERWGVPVPRRD
jgi:hypothetical protein